jgi:deoxyribodipyrimidine photolyase-related protein
MPESKTYHTLRLILGDQLNHQHSWFKKTEKHVLYVMMEVKEESAYVTHHVQKVIGFFSAMRNFADTLKMDGHQIVYFKIHDSFNRQTIYENIKELIVRFNIKRLEYQLPDEYRLDKLLKECSDRLPIETSCVNTEHFLTERNELKDFFNGKKTYLMESFYRHMRIKYQVLMNGDKPLFDQWNFDAENRQKLPADLKPPHPLLFNRYVKELLDEIKLSDIKTIGSVDPENFIWPVTRQESLELLQFFVKELIPFFGTYQDAMSVKQWSLYHSRLSFSMNVKLLHPLEVITAAIQQWQEHPGKISYNQVEGFVRQILGWREYMRGVYWAQMPDYAKTNFFKQEGELPAMYWTGKTSMNCMKEAIGQSLEYAYAHHIQRLMITGNFALLAGVHPDAVDAWYLGIYMDAIEWVEITNTRGMSQFADGGLLATKPYVSSAAYIDKMSDYCKTCYYDKKKKTGDKACPFNSLYWNFFDRHRALLEKNPRIGMMYKVWDKMDAQTKSDMLKQAKFYLNHLHEI